MKQRVQQVLKPVLLGSLILSLSACGVLKQYDRRVEYKKSDTAPRLELPPDLQATQDDELVIPGSGDTLQTRYSDYEKRQNRGGQGNTAATVVSGGASSSALVSNPEGIQVQRSGDVRWLVIQQPADKVWNRARDFWLESGFLLKREDAKLGVIETEWNENRGDIPEDMLRNTLGSIADFMWSSSTRDKFRVRVERTGDNRSELFLSHRGAEQIFQNDTMVWQFRPTDPGLESEMLIRLMIYMGLQEEQARKLTEAASDTSKAQRVNDVLKVQEGFESAWRRTGLALDRLGFSVEDRKPESGIYLVRYVPNENLNEDDKGLLDRFTSIFSSDDTPESEEYQIQIRAEGDTSLIRVLDKNGDAAPEAVAVKILDLLQSQLR